MNKVIKSILYIVGVLIVLAAVFWCSIVYVSEYKITTCDTAVSPDERYKLILQAVGEPDWPFGSASGRVVLKKDDQEISNAEFELHNDGGSISNRCWTVTWYDEYAEVTLSGEEQSDEHILLYYDGKTERRR
ncbi:hypothetical protein [Anaerostipes caccae]|uniref:hypothetical protein n=1 Tax=Anaerostipes caccae TaxID=105841 RepID=UPI002670DEEC|nr:hypothetical protein [Anaerostipes caccae]